jgi:hypothetical protein
MLRKAANLPPRTRREISYREQGGKRFAATRKKDLLVAEKVLRSVTPFA